MKKWSMKDKIFLFLAIVGTLGTIIGTWGTIYYGNKSAKLMGDKKEIKNTVTNIQGNTFYNALPQDIKTSIDKINVISSDSVAVER